MSFSPAFLDELRSRVPLSALAGKKLRLVKAGREYKACCPFHDEKTPSFYLNDSKQFYHCFGCGVHGDIISLSMRLDNLSFPEAIEKLAALAGLPVPQDTPQDKTRYDTEKRLHTLMERAANWFAEQLFTPRGREGMLYLKNRGLSAEAMRRFNLGYAPQESQALIKALAAEKFTTDEMMQVGLIKKSEDRNEYFSFFRNRVMFPVGDRRGRPVAFGGRVMGDGEPKYLNSPDNTLFHKGKLLYGLSRARMAVAEGQPLLVVEGYMDVIALINNGFSGAVAPLGTAMTEDQMRLLWQLLPPLEHREIGRDYSPILCFDGDNAGQKAAARAIDRALPLLTAAQTFRVAFLPEGEDPDSLLRQSNRQAMQSVLDRSQNLNEILWNMTAAGRRLETPEDKASFFTALRAKTDKITDETLRKLYKDLFAEKIAGIFHTSQTQPRPTGYTNYESYGHFSAYGPPTAYANGQAMPKSAAYGKSIRGKSAGGNSRQFPPPMLNRKTPLAAKNLRERIFFALILNHPTLFNEFGEDFANLKLQDPRLEPLRQEIIAFLLENINEPLDAAALFRHLNNGEDTANKRPQLAQILSEQTYMRAKGARPEQPVETARQEWRLSWQSHLREILQPELQEAERDYARDPSEANKSRVTALRRSFEILMMVQSDPGSNPLDEMPSSFVPSPNTKAGE